MRGHASSGRDDVPDGIREIELALRFVRVKLLERAPERGGVEDVVRGVQLLDRPLFGGRVPLLDDARDVSVRVADDAPVGKGHLRREGKRSPRSVAAMRLDQLLEHLRGDERRIARDDQDTAVETIERAARRRNRVPRSTRSACTATSTESS